LGEAVVTKVCALCGEEKPLEEFNVFERSADGHQGYCRDCNRAYLKGYRAEPR
jgi:hypothetical protein